MADETKTETAPEPDPRRLGPGDLEGRHSAAINQAGKLADTADGVARMVGDRIPVVAAIRPVIEGVEEAADHVEKGRYGSGAVTFLTAMARGAAAFFVPGVGRNVGDVVKTAVSESTGLTARSGGLTDEVVIAAVKGTSLEQAVLDTTVKFRGRPNETYLGDAYDGIKEVIRQRGTPSEGAPSAGAEPEQAKADAILEGARPPLFVAREDDQTGIRRYWASAPAAVLTETAVATEAHAAALSFRRDPEGMTQQAGYARGLGLLQQVAADRGLDLTYLTPSLTRDAPGPARSIAMTRESGRDDMGR
jgi:hypothetical protein